MKSSSLNTVVGVFVAVAVLLQATQRAAAFSALPVACIAEARALCRESPGLLQVRRCLAKQDGVSVACKSALDARGNLRKSVKRLLNEAPSWENTLFLNGDTKSANVNWSIVDANAPIVEADMTAAPQSWIGFGFSFNGGAMIGSVAVVYQPDNTGNEVQAFTLNGKNEAQFTAFTPGALTDIAHSQNGSQTYMHFQIDMTGTGLATGAGVSSDWIWAVGASNTFTLGAGYHGANKGTFSTIINANAT